jgi:hypothetical protein
MENQKSGLQNRIELTYNRIKGENRKTGFPLFLFKLYQKTIPENHTRKPYQKTG